MTKPRLDAPEKLRVAISATLYSPSTLFLGSAVLWIVLFALTPVTPTHQFSFATIFVALSLFVSFLAGMLLSYPRLRPRRITVIADVSALNRSIATVLFIGASSFVLRLFDLHYSRGLSLGFDVLANKAAYQSGDTSALSFASEIGAHFLLFLPILVLARRATQNHTRYDILLLVAPLLYGAILALMLSLRYPLIIAALILLASWLTFLRPPVHHRLALTAIFLLALVTLSGVVLATRIQAGGLDPIQSMQESVYAFFVPITPTVSAALASADPVGSGIVFALITASQYYLAGLFELLFVVQSGIEAHTLGAYSFIVPAKVMGTLLGTGKEQIDAILQGNMIRQNVYTTLVGPALYDFGPVLGASLLFAFGLLSGLSARWFSAGGVYFYFIVITFVPFSFAVNLFVFLTGQYLLMIALLLLGVELCRRQPVFEAVNRVGRFRVRAEDGFRTEPASEALNVPQQGCRNSNATARHAEDSNDCRS